MRSLLYAREVIVNRAFFVNTPYLFEHYDSLRGAQDFAELMNTGAIVPFVTGQGLLDQRDFEKHPRGAKALERLLPRIQHIQSVTMKTPGEAGPENRNPGPARNPLAEMGLHFTQLLAGLGGLNAETRAVLLGELGAPTGILALAHPNLQGEFQQLIDRLQALASEKLNANPAQVLTRDEIYRTFFCVRDRLGAAVANGDFLPELPSSTALMLLKKLVDTIYNFNLPDHLACFGMTVPGTVGRTLVDLIRRLTGHESPNVSQPRTIRAEEERLLERVRAVNQKYLRESFKVSLPCLEKLSIKDVYTIRKQDRWKSFMGIKHKLLETPHADELEDVFEEYVRRHKELHEGMSRSFARTIPMEKPVQAVSFLDHPILQLLASPVAAALNAPQGVTDAIDFLIDVKDKPSSLEFGLRWIDDKRPGFFSSLAFHGVERLQAESREELKRLKKELADLKATARPNDNQRVENQRVEQSKS
jgi:hypothetical protein